MKKIPLSIAAATVAIAGGTAAFAAELPTYGVKGFPVSPLQVRVLGATNVGQQPVVSTAMATPHQVSVLTPRRKVKTATAAPVTTGAGR